VDVIVRILRPLPPPSQTPMASVAFSSHFHPVLSSFLALRKGLLVRMHFYSVSCRLLVDINGTLPLSWDYLRNSVWFSRLSPFFVERIRFYQISLSNGHPRASPFDSSFTFLQPSPSFWWDKCFLCSAPLSPLFPFPFRQFADPSINFASPPTLFLTLFAHLMRSFFSPQDRPKLLLFPLSEVPPFSW